ncbi:uncharacterized protein LOC127103324 [Lathyrus oleraceus]|uniref:DUF7769 domain-containing protein n=1 Tax=Pisum sativum TaxID=3888 RepID=A0A9D4ZXW0_PEA|nr:uncharacterized protein LOC127103324 [Pisum sativum]KAI5387909.1 hypothetical protein KIW84_073851 [Pisum sativum]
MDLDSDTETSLTNQHIFELYEFDEDNLEEEFEATNNIDESCEDNLQEEVETNNDTVYIAENVEAEPREKKRLRILSNEERMYIYHELLQKSVDGKLRKGATNEVASSNSVPLRTVQRIWKRAKESETRDVSHRKTKNCGRKRISIDENQIRELPFSQRTNIRSLAFALKTNPTSVSRLIKSGAIRRNSNAIKPLLKEENKISRLEFCLSMLEGTPHDPMFKSMHNIIHIDEKWFYMTKKSEKYYLLPDEDEPYRTCKSKNFIAKVMFLVAQTRPRFDSEENETFSGKIGVFPFVTHEPAIRSSINRVAGTMVTKAITTVNRDVVRSFLIDKVLPAIREKWPRDEFESTIFIQQDNARTHINHDDPLFREAATKDGFDIRLMCQPANSPDLNILDLGFFSAIQSLQYKEAPKTIDELISAVVKSFENFPSIKSNRIFVSLQLCMIEIMKEKGSNKYKIPHVNKERLERVGQLPIQIKCDPILVQEVKNYLNME